MFKINENSLKYDYFDDATNTVINDVCPVFKQTRVCYPLRDDENLSPFVDAKFAMGAGNHKEMRIYTHQLATAAKFNDFLFSRGVFIKRGFASGIHGIFMEPLDSGLIPVIYQTRRLGWQSLSQSRKY